MIKQLVRGVVYFDDKKIEDVKHVFENFRFDEASFKFFDKIKINNKEINSPGVFLNGQINEKYTSENVVRLFRKLMGLNIEKESSDISIEREDVLDELDKGREFGNYYILDFIKTEINENKEKFIKELGEEVFFRTRDVGYKEGEIVTALEIFSANNIDEKINNIILAEKINIKNRINIQF
ncbi:MAG: hypothetical protein PF572_02545 [Patescibacteria group bacterium]|jgi:hypothetical protein|nr:hypothetical protein [Patescibacteria group bacterium]